MDLEGKVVLVTGASSGIGAATAERFAREGCDVAVLARSQEGLDVVAARVREHGRRALVLPVDVTDRTAVHDAVERVRAEFGGLDVLVSNAAATVFGRFEHVSPEDFDRTIDVTFTGAVNVIRACLPALAERQGNIIAIGSINTRMPLPTFSPYASAKHALRGFLGTLRVELHAAGDPVSVTLLNPGPVDTPLWDTTTSATGKRARKPPDAYRPEVYAKAAVDCVRNPRDELTLGGAARLLELTYQLARPVGERVLAFAHRLYQSGTLPVGPDDKGGLWEPQGTGAVRDGVHGRPSLWAPIRLAVDAPLRVLRR